MCKWLELDDTGEVVLEADLEPGILPPACDSWRFWPRARRNSMALSSLTTTIKTRLRTSEPSWTIWSLKYPLHPASRVRLPSSLSMSMISRLSKHLLATYAVSGQDLHMNSINDVNRLSRFKEIIASICGLISSHRPSLPFLLASSSAHTMAFTTRWPRYASSK